MLSWNWNDLGGNPLGGSQVAMESPLKLPMPGLRLESGEFEEEGNGGFYWTSNYDLDDYTPVLLSIAHDAAQIERVSRAVGLSVRCIKD